MNVRFSFLDIDIDNTTHTYGLFLGNGLVIGKSGRRTSHEFSLLRVEYSLLTGFELEILGVVLL